MSTNRLLVTTLALCAVTDLVCAPIPVSGHGTAPAGLIAAVVALAVLTGYAAFAVARGSRAGRPLAWGTRVVDVVACMPAFGGNTTAVVAGAVAVGLSLSAIVLLVRTRKVVQVATVS